MQLLFLYRRVLITLLAQTVSLPGKAAASKAGGFWASIMKNRQKASAHAAATKKQGYSSDCAARPRYDNQPAIGTNPHGE